MSFIAKCSGLSGTGVSHKPGFAGSLIILMQSSTLKSPVTAMRMGPYSMAYLSCPWIWSAPVYLVAMKLIGSLNHYCPVV